MFRRIFFSFCTPIVSNSRDFVMHKKLPNNFSHRFQYNSWKIVYQRIGLPRELFSHASRLTIACLLNDGDRSFVHVGVKILTESECTMQPGVSAEERMNSSFERRKLQFVRIIEGKLHWIAEGKWETREIERKPKKGECVCVWYMWWCFQLTLYMNIAYA